MTASGTTSDYEWQQVTMNDNEWQRVTKNDSEWQRMTMSDKTNENEVILCFKMKQKPNLVPE